MRQVLGLIHQLGAQIGEEGSGVQLIGADIVEINPDRDIYDMTAMVGAKLLREVLGILTA